MLNEASVVTANRKAPPAGLSENNFINASFNLAGTSSNTFRSAGNANPKFLSPLNGAARRSRSVYRKSRRDVQDRPIKLRSGGGRVFSLLDAIFVAVSVRTSKD